MIESKNLVAIIKELAENARMIDGAQLDAVVKLICDAKRVFIAGAGRSGFAARGFSNRLMHLGFTVYFVGEPTTPSIQKGDLLIIGSGSGTTGSLVTMAKKASEKGASIATLTIYPTHTIGACADAVIEIPGVTAKCGEETGTGDSIQPLGSSFEEMSWLVYDAMVIDLKRIKNQTNEDMFVRHANLE